MTCYHPIEAYRTPDGVCFSELSRYDILGRIQLPCGMCIGCRMRRASDWALRVMHEAQSHPVNSFVTLTYARGNLPPGASLDHRHFQLFMKRLRRSVKYPVRFYMCGEYGPLNQRPHYHACLFGEDFNDSRVLAGKSGSGFSFYESARLTQLWGLGRAVVQDLVPQTASYCARYIMHKKLGVEADSAYDLIDEDGVITKRRPEYSAMSLKPGIGADWFRRYKRSVFPHDFVVQDGVKRPVPKYYDKLADKEVSIDLDSVEFARFVRAQAAVEDSTPERLVVREIVHNARISSLKRDSDV